MDNGSLPAYIKWLLRECIYPHDTNEIRLIQTHISFVILAGEYVYKWKKPVDFGFLNFSTLAKRKFFCQKELELNRRLCPGIYLDLVSLNSVGYSYALDGSGDIVEYGVKMVRMPEHRMMNRVIESSQLKKGDIDRIVNTLIPFYERVEREEAIKEFGSSRAVAVNVMGNFHLTKRFVGSDLLHRSQFERIKKYSLTILAKESLFERRIAAGKIHDCHGDLHSANICLADEVYIFDCIEFNDSLRFSDVAADVAFLAMDLDFHGLEDLSTYFLKSFIRQSDDSQMYEVINFYMCYRAFVRGKICLLTVNDPGVDGQTKRRCSQQAVKYFSLAAHYCLEGGV